MAQAPKPGTVAQHEQAQVAKTTVTIAFRGESWTVAPFNLPLTEAMTFRKATGGMPVESFWNGDAAIGVDSLKVLWWLARRATGEKSLTLDQAWDDWPADLAADELDVRIDEPEADDPEV